MRWDRHHEVLTMFTSADFAGKYIIDWFTKEKDTQTIRADIKTIRKSGIR